MTFLPAPHLFADDGVIVPFQEAIDYHRQKVDLPTKGWRDISGRAHDRAFVVAGATREALIADLRAEIDKAVAGKTTLAEFRKNFDAIVARNGWTGWTGEGTAAGRAWRTRVIYETNLKTAYAAGRWAQMTDPDVVKVYKWWRYRHAWYRVPDRARPEHRDVWNMTVLRWDSPWWATHYPPNGWNCSCGVETLSDRDLAAEGIEPDDEPPVATRKVRDPGTGEMIDVPVGIDLGWDHAPGMDWSRGVTPPPLQKPLRPSIGPAQPPPASQPVAPPPAARDAAGTGAATTPAPLPVMPPLPQAKPFVAPLAPEGQAPQAYVDAFLGEFGATAEKPVLWRDPAGHAVVISEQLFRDGQGRLKLPFELRELHVLRLAEAVKDPDEIWLDWSLGPDGATRLTRRYLRASPDSPEFASFVWSQQGWTGATAFNPVTGRKWRPNPAYLDKQRTGALLWRRPEDENAVGGADGRE